MNQPRPSHTPVPDDLVRRVAGLAAGFPDQRSKRFAFGTVLQFLRGERSLVPANVAMFSRLAESVAFDAGWSSGQLESVHALLASRLPPLPASIPVLARAPVLAQVPDVVKAVLETPLAPEPFADPDETFAPGKVFSGRTVHGGAGRPDAAVATAPEVSGPSSVEPDADLPTAWVPPLAPDPAHSRTRPADSPLETLAPDFSLLAERLAGPVPQDAPASLVLLRAKFLQDAVAPADWGHYLPDAAPGDKHAAWFAYLATLGYAAASHGDPVTDEGRVIGDLISRPEFVEPLFFAADKYVTWLLNDKGGAFDSAMLTSTEGRDGEEEGPGSLANLVFTPLKEAFENYLSAKAEGRFDDALRSASAIPLRAVFVRHTRDVPRTPSHPKYLLALLVEGIPEGEVPFHKAHDVLCGAIEALDGKVGRDDAKTGRISTKVAGSRSHKKGKKGIGFKGMLKDLEKNHRPHRRDLSKRLRDTQDGSVALSLMESVKRSATSDLHPRPAYVRAVSEFVKRFPQYKDGDLRCWLDLFHA